MIKINLHKKVISKIKGASQAHKGQAKDLEKLLVKKKIVDHVTQDDM